MRVSRITAFQQGEEMQLTAHVSYENRSVDLPETLWFRLPNEFAPQDLSRCSNTLLATLILPAMWLGEDLEVEGIVSKTLYDNITQYQYMHAKWRPDLYHVIDVFCEQVVDQPMTRKEGVMCSFSGGVDSFHCLKTFLPRGTAPKEQQITHALFIKGFDIPLADTHTFETAMSAYRTLMEKHRITFVPLYTNLHSFHLKPDWDIAYCNTYSSLAHLFSELIGTFYMSEMNTQRYGLPRQKERYFENPSLPLLSSHVVHTRNVCGNFSKYEKISDIAGWEPTRDALRVCWEHLDGLQNCSRCTKCLYTMTALDIYGVLSQYTTFKQPVDRRARRACRYALNRVYYPGGLFAESLTYKRYDVAFDYAYIMVMSYIDACRFAIQGVFLKYGNPMKFGYRFSAHLKKKSQTYERAVKILKGKSTMTHDV